MPYFGPVVPPRAFFLFVSAAYTSTYGVSAGRKPQNVLFLRAARTGLDMYALTDTGGVQMAKCRRPTLYGRCRKCDACLETRQRAWLLRMLMEAMLYDPSEVTFLTLTYAPENLPESEVLAKRSLQLWLKRLRRELGAKSLRYVAALEKGSQATRRYHWHAILYGVRFTAVNKHVIRRSWANGFIEWKPATPARMSYVLKYVIKGGKFLMSRRPGIGEGMIESLNQMIDTLSPGERAKLDGRAELLRFCNSYFNQHSRRSRTISALQVGKFYYPIHDYYRRRLRDLRRKF